MAAANEKATCSISKKISLGNGTYRYYGTFAFGTEYAAGGMTLTTATNERYSLPEKIDYMEIGAAGGWKCQYVPSTGKVIAYGGAAAAKGAGAENTTADISAAVKGVPFVLDGC